MDEALTRWTVRIALACYFLGAAMLISRRHGRVSRPWQPSWDWWARAAWTAGCVLYLVHVIAAFHFYHDWSHSSAYEHTAARTRELVGWRWGGGLYFNYLFTAAWLADVVWWWCGPESYRARSQYINIGLHAFMLFVVFNATVVFGTGAVRWFGLVGIGALAIVWWIARRCKRRSAG